MFRTMTLAAALVATAGVAAPALAADPLQVAVANYNASAETGDRIVLQPSSGDVVTVSTSNRAFAKLVSVINGSADNQDERIAVMGTSYSANSHSERAQAIFDRLAAESYEDE